MRGVGGEEWRDTEEGEVGEEREDAVEGEVVGAGYEEEEEKRARRKTR